MNGDRYEPWPCDPQDHVPCVGCGDDGWQLVGSTWVQCGCPVGRRQAAEESEADFASLSERAEQEQAA